MKVYKKIGLALSFLSIFILAAFAIYNLGFKKEIGVVQADDSQNIFGWAWSSNVGWISFNSINCDSDDSGSTDSCAPDCADGTPINPYGVNIDDATGNFSGYAWSSNVGWISFEENPAPDYDFASNCDDDGEIECTSSVNCTACLDRNTGNVYGWANIVSMGDDGWIKLSDDSWSNGVTVDMDTGVFDGYAWNGNDNGTGIGWISFNCATGDEDGSSSVCGDSYYRVEGDINMPPSAINLSAPNWSPTEACGTENALIAKLQWEYSDDDTASAYSIVVRRLYDDALIVNSGKCIGENLGDGNVENLDCKISVGWTDGDIVSYPLGNDELSFDAGLPGEGSYKWSVEVWDSNGMSSGVVEFNTDLSGHVLTDNVDANNDRGSSLSFTTYKHNFPVVKIPDYFPSPPSSGVPTQFTDKSEFYFTNNSISQLCDEDNCDWFWSVDFGDISDPNASTTIITFDDSGERIVTIRITQIETPTNYVCEKSFPVITQLGLPIWEEIKKEAEED